MLPLAVVPSWYLAEHDIKDKQLPQRLITDEKFDLLTKAQETGLRIHKFDADNHEKDDKFKNMITELGYNRSDIVEINSDILPDYKKMTTTWYTEHFHPDDEVRLILDGTGYWDFRDIDDRWVRLEISKNDLVMIPSGMYHRFTNESNDYCKMKRLYTDTTVWVAHFRPFDDHPVRLKYLKTLENKVLVK